MKWFLVILLVSSILEAQVKPRSVTGPIENSDKISAVNSRIQRSPTAEIFKKVEFGLQNNSVEYFKNELGDIVSMTISSGEHGYYSSNQAVSVLVGYFSERRLNSFEFSKIYEKGNMPYATGRFIYIQKGIQKSAQVYVSLTKQDSKWIISQFNIY
jgi:hypothetical protein